MNNQEDPSVPQQFHQQGHHLGNDGGVSAFEGVHTPGAWFFQGGQLYVIVVQPGIFPFWQHPLLPCSSTPPTAGDYQGRGSNYGQDFLPVLAALPESLALGGLPPGQDRLMGQPEAWPNRNLNPEDSAEQSTNDDSDDKDSSSLSPASAAHIEH